MRIPIDALEPDTLNRIIESFVLREGTDYGDQLYSLEDKVDHVRKQLESGEAVLIYSEEYETVDIRLQQDLN